MSSKIRPLHFVTYSGEQSMLPLHSMNTAQGFYPANPSPPTLLPQESLFDRYFRTSLKLIECAPRDVQMLNKDILIAEGQMSESLLHQIHSHTQQVKSVNKQDHAVKSIPLVRQEQSEECRQNEALFNAKKMVEQKMSRQKGFLTAMEQKIQELETKAALLNEMQEEEKMEIEKVKLIQARAAQELSKEEFLEKVNKIAEEALAAGMEKERNLHEHMPKDEINQVLEDHYSRNQRLIDEVYRVTRQSIQGEKPQNKKQVSNLKQTKKIVKVGGVQKKVTKGKGDHKN